MGLLRNTIYYSIGEICPRIISFLLLPIYTRFLTTQDYGILSYINSVIIFLLVLGTLSLNSFVIRYYFIYKTELERKRLIGNVYVFIGLINLLLFGLLNSCVPTILVQYNIQIPWIYLQLALIINLLDSFSIIPLVIYRVQQKPIKFVALSLSRTLLVVVLNVYFIVYERVGIIGYYYSMLCIYIPYFFIYLLIVRKNAIFCLDRKEILVGLKYALPILPSALSYLILTTSDRLLLERNVSLSLIGIYNVAYTLSLALNIVVQSAYKAIEPEIFKNYGTGGFDTFINNVKRVFFPVLYILGLGICLFSQEIFRFMTSEGFHQGYRLVPLLVLTAIMTGQNVIFSGVLSAERRTKVIGVIVIIGAVFSLSINLIFIPVWGVWGAAISSSSSFLLMNYLLYKKASLKKKSIWRETVSVLVIPLLSYMLYCIDIPISFTLVLIKIVLVVVFSLFVLILFGWRISDLNAVLAYLNKNKYQ